MLRVILRPTIQSILEEGIELVIKALSHKLNMPTFYCHHQWSHSGLGHDVYLELFFVDEELKVLFLSSTTDQVQGSSSKLILVIEIRVQLQDFRKVSWATCRCNIHKEVDTILHDRLIDGEAMSHHIQAGLDLALIDSFDDHCFGTKHVLLTESLTLYHLLSPYFFS